jgi:hypothetical protein
MYFKDTYGFIPDIAFSNSSRQTDKGNKNSFHLTFKNASLCSKCQLKHEFSSLMWQMESIAGAPADNMLMLPH